MPAKKRRRALPREGGQKETTLTTNQSPPQASLLPPDPVVRRSERIRKQIVNEAPDPPTKTRSVPKRRANQGGENFTAGAPKPRQSRDHGNSRLYSKLSSWLDEVRIGAAAVAEAAEEFDSDQSSLDGSAMESSVVSLTTLGTFDRPSAIGPHRLRAKKVTRRSFRTRNVMINAPRADEWTPKFKKLLVEKPIKIPFDKTQSLQKSVKHFLEKAKKAKHGENSYDAIEELREEINKWTATMRLAAVTNQEFKNDLEHCKAPANEAVFQRTIMMSIIDRFHLKSAFDFNCEGHWSLQGSHPLPSTGGPSDLITGPKPDLAIFFRFDSLVGMELRNQIIPAELESCLNPDNHEERCFPFIFIEAKKGFSDIEPAVLANMHSASQALFNIYTWMVKAGHQAAFFKDVRLFSFAINAQQIIARVHRAVPIDVGGQIGLEFYYDELNTQIYYTRDKICTLIHNILSEYAESKLLGVLKAAVEKVLKENRQGLKRQRDAAILDRSPKRLMSAQAGPEGIGNPSVDPLASFGMSQVEIDDR
ncbi:hypothetical protein F5B21DRAFT_503150 [Xylaria acuta]|nr:hypothetical protein F5B21DRAFT_503150 [Xylaria acuta]